jgi:hypothetical protein
VTTSLDPRLSEVLARSLTCRRRTDTQTVPRDRARHVGWSSICYDFFLDMPFVPGCHHDIFVSYASETNQDKWVAQFVHKLSPLIGAPQRAGVNRTLSVRARASRTVTPVAVPNRHARGERRDQGRARWSMTHPSTFVAGNAARFIGERAATRGRIATEGGDERALASRTGSNGGSLDPLAATRPSEARYAKAHRPEPTSSPPLDFILGTAQRELRITRRSICSGTLRGSDDGDRNRARARRSVVRDPTAVKQRTARPSSRIALAHARHHSALSRFANSLGHLLREQADARHARETGVSEKDAARCSSTAPLPEKAPVVLPGSICVMDLVKTGEDLCKWKSWLRAREASNGP